MHVQQPGSCRKRIETGFDDTQPSSTCPAAQAFLGKIIIACSSGVL